VQFNNCKNQHEFLKMVTSYKNYETKLHMTYNHM
jgi:hypothetical protein